MPRDYRDDRDRDRDRGRERSYERGDRGGRGRDDWDSGRGRGDRGYDDEHPSRSGRRGGERDRGYDRDYDDDYDRKKSQYDHDDRGGYDVKERRGSQSKDGPGRPRMGEGDGSRHKRSGSLSSDSDSFEARMRQRREKRASRFGSSTTIVPNEDAIRARLDEAARGLPAKPPPKPRSFSGGFDDSNRSIGGPGAIEKRNRELFIGNLVSGEVSEGDVKRLFQQLFDRLPEYEQHFGRTEAVKVVRLAGEGKFGFVEFDDPIMASTALKFDKVILKGRPMAVGRPKDWQEPKEIAPSLDVMPLVCASLIAGGRPPVGEKCYRELHIGAPRGEEVAGLSVEDVLSSYGPLINAVCPKEDLPAIVEARMGTNGRYGFIEFRTPELATQALDTLNGVELNGVVYSLNRPSSFPGGGGGRKKTENKGQEQVPMMAVQVQLPGGGMGITMVPVSMIGGIKMMPAGSAPAAPAAAAAPAAPAMQAMPMQPKAMPPPAPLGMTPIPTSFGTPAPPPAPAATEEMSPEQYKKMMMQMAG